MSAWFWLLLVVALGLLGLPWFAALGLVLLAMTWHSGMDSLLILLEFSRLRELEPLLAIPLVWWSARLLRSKRISNQPGSTDSGASSDWSGLWLLGSTDTAVRHRALSLSLMPGVALLSVWASLTMVSPARAPGLNELFLAALLPLLLGLLLTATVQRSIHALNLGGWTKHRLLLLMAGALLLGGVYLDRWPVLDAAAVWAVLVAALQIHARHVSAGQAGDMLIHSLKQFGQLSLLFGLGLAWAMLVFDSGLNRHWLEPLALLFGGGQLGLLIGGLWLGIVWTVAAWKLRPLPALVILAPWLLPPALHLGIPASALAMLVVLSLHAGSRLALPSSHDNRTGSPLPELGLSVLLISLLLTVPALTTWPAGLAG